MVRFRRRHLRLRVIALHGYEVGPKLRRIRLHAITRFSESSRARQWFVTYVYHAVASPRECSLF